MINGAQQAARRQRDQHEELWHSGIQGQQPSWQRSTWRHSQGKGQRLGPSWNVSSGNNISRDLRQLSIESQGAEVQKVEGQMQGGQVQGAHSMKLGTNA